MSDKITLVTTGVNWLGHGVLSSSDTIEELITEAENSIVFTAFSITNDNIISSLKKALSRGREVVAYINKSLEHNDTALNTLISFRDEDKLPIKIVEINDVVLHAKVLITDGANIYCGSANLSHNGMNNNYELGLLIKDNPKIAGDIISVLKKLVPK